MELIDKKWKSFMFPEIFVIKGGFYNKKPVAEENGKIPFIGAIDSNNGISQFNSLKRIDETSKTGDEKNSSLEKKIFKGNCIVVTNNGSVGYAYYQRHSFTCSHDVNPLYLKNKTLTQNLALFLISAIEQQRECFCYIHKWRPERMRKSKILLPISENGQPDYEFMEKYIDSRVNIKRKEYNEFCKIELNKIKNISRSIPLELKKWKCFKLLDLFDFKKGNQSKMNSLHEGNKVLISAKNINNGLKAFVLNNNKSLYDGNTISLNLDGDGGVGIAYFQPYEYMLDSHCACLKPKYEMNKYTMQFICVCITKQRCLYSHGRSINEDRLKLMKIMLPITENETPDYKYMELYVKNIILNRIQSYINYVK